MKNFNAILFVSLLIVCGCARNEKKTFDIDKTNDDIIKNVGVNLLKFKSQVDKVYNSKTFYDTLVNDIAVNNQSKIFDHFGLISKYDNGQLIDPKDAGKITSQVAKSIAKNIVFKDCHGIDSDSTFCNFKKKYQNNLNKTKGTWLMTPTTSEGQLQMVYKDGLLNYDEFSYLCIVYHFWHSLDIIEEEDR